MKIRRDLFRVASGARDEGGHKMEPEEQPTARVVVTDSPATLGGQEINRSIPTEIVAYSTAGEVGLAQSSTCANCKYFDRAWWVKTINDAEQFGTHEERTSINQIRGHLLAEGIASAEDDDLEHALREFGKCHALTEHYKELVPVHPLAACPGEVRDAGHPHGFFKPRDGEHARAAMSARDKLLQQAAGKAP